MKIVCTFLFLLAAYWPAEAQKTALRHNHTAKSKAINYNGQWRGGFNDNIAAFSSLGADNTGYVLELDVQGTHVSGYSYSYFNSGPQKYYTICRLSGTLNLSTKELVVTEVERTKSNTPPFFSSCLQVHTLKYELEDDGKEVLRGTWVPAPNQETNCGTGITVLSRKKIEITPLGITPPQKSTDNRAIAKAPQKHTPAPKRPATAVPKKVIPHKEVVVVPKKSLPDIAKDSEEEKNNAAQIKVPEKPVTIPAIPKGFENRRNDIVQTIKITQPTFRVDFYDNGEIDGDSISVFYNGRLVLSHQRISDKAVTLNLKLDENVRENIVTMYANNLGTIPPNTAVMIVTDGSKRYEVRMESDLKKSGSVIFMHDDK